MTYICTLKHSCSSTVFHSVIYENILRKIISKSRYKRVKDAHHLFHEYFSYIFHFYRGRTQPNCHWQTLSNQQLSNSQTSMAIGTDCIEGRKYINHSIAATMVPQLPQKEIDNIKYQNNAKKQGKCVQHTSQIKDVRFIYSFVLQS